MSQEYGINMPLANPTLIPDEIMSLFGRPPVVVTESKDVYLRQLECIAAAIGPEDIIEWIMVKAIADLSWEMRGTSVPRRVSLIVRESWRWSTSSVPSWRNPPSRRRANKMQWSSPRTGLPTPGQRGHS